MKSQKMRVLLLYPQQTEKPKQRLSRAGAQLNGITSSVKSLLDRFGSQIEVSTFACEQGSEDKAANPATNRSSLAKVFEASDTVIDISLEADINVKPADFAGPVIHLSPSFSGSFACNDISIKGGARLMQSDVVSCISQSRDSYLDLLPSTKELDANMHYAAFSPLPSRVGDAFYRNEKDHALIFLSYPAHLRNDDVVYNDLETLNQTLHTVENLRSLTFVCESLRDLPIIQKVADNLKQSLGLSPSIWGLRKGEYHDMFSIMAKSDIVFFGGNSLYADAIVRGIPVFVWRTNQPGTQNISQAYSQYTEDQNREALLAEQRKQLETMFAAQYLDATVPNQRRCFDTVLINLISLCAKGKQFDLTSAGTNVPEWVIAPAMASEGRNLPDKLRRSVWSDRQKLLQFKQSQNREIMDSGDRGDRQVFTKVSG